MKAGWQQDKLMDVCEKITDGTHQTPKYFDDGYIFLSSRNVTSGKIDWDKIKYIDEKQHEEMQKRVSPRVGDILLAKNGTTGVAAMVDRDVPFDIYVSLAFLRPLEGIIPTFLLHFVNSPIAKEQFNKRLKGVGVPNLHLKEIREVLISYPKSLAEQERIVAILDEAFEAIATATAHTERNLHNARELFQSVLQSTFEQPGEDLNQAELKSENGAINRIDSSSGKSKSTKTGGRDATTRKIVGPLSLAVGNPQTSTKEGWKWERLGGIARLESGHTPSRRHPEYWGGDVPWMGIKDARISHGGLISETLTNTNDLGIENSSARVLPEGTVCLSRTASVGYVVVMGVPMATSQDFVNWVCSEKLNPNFLQYIFLAEGREGLLRYASGSVHQTIYYPEAKGFYVCIPSVAQQQQIVQKLDALAAETRRLEAVYERKLAALAELKQSLLQRAFAGEL